MQDPLIINVCLTGMVPTKAAAPHLPTTPREIAEDIRRCRDAGASMFHIHVRDEEGHPTWAPERFQETLAAIADTTPEVIRVVTTSGRNWPELEKRAASLLPKGPLRPDMASLTLGSMNFPTSASVNPPEVIQALAQRMAELGIVPELEVFDVGMANYSRFLIKQGVLKPPFYYNILLGSLGTAELSALNVGTILAALPEGAVWALAGVGRYQLAANTLAIALGGHVRVGLEDNPYYSWSRREPADNPRLVERLVRIAREFEREPAPPLQARQMIGLSASR